MSKQRLGKYFLLRQKLNVHLVLEIKDGVDRPDVGVVAGEVEGEADAKEHQLWFSDHLTQTIRSKLNNFCLDLSSKLSISTCVHLKNQLLFFYKSHPIFEQDLADHMLLWSPIMLAAYMFLFHMMFMYIYIG